MKNPIKTFMLIFIIPAILILSSYKNDKDSNQDLTSSEKDTMENNVATDGIMILGNCDSNNGSTSINNSAIKISTSLFQL